MANANIKCHTGTYSTLVMCHLLKCWANIFPRCEMYTCLAQSSIFMPNFARQF